MICKIYLNKAVIQKRHTDTYLQIKHFHTHPDGQAMGGPARNYGDSIAESCSLILQLSVSSPSDQGKTTGGQRQ